MLSPRIPAYLFPLVFWLSLPPIAGADEEVSFKLRRLSDRVIVLTEDSPMENNVIAIASQKGLVVVDSSGSRITAAKIRERIEREFDRKDFVFLINTHHHWDHALGNQVFTDAVIIGHENCVEAMRLEDAGRAQRISRMGGSLKTAETELAGLDTASPEAVELANRVAFSRRNYLGLREGFVLTPPELTFKDRLILDLGDLTVRLVYFGRAHSGSDILIEVPEEGLLFTGDLFLDQGWLPLFASMPRLDVPRFIEVLGQVLDGRSRVETVIPGHRDPWIREKLELCRNYIKNLWMEVNVAAEKGLGPEAVRERFPLGEEFAYLKELGHSDALLERFHMDNIRAFLRQLKTSAADFVEQAAAEQGIEAALEEFEALRIRDGGSMMIDETEFNALGYRFLLAGDLDAAIAVFKLNVELFPASWNVHDSLGEGFMTAGKKDLAIQYYRKSLELNPANENGKAMLKRLEGD